MDSERILTAEVTINGTTLTEDQSYAIRDCLVLMWGNLEKGSGVDKAYAEKLKAVMSLFLARREGA